MLNQPRFMHLSYTFPYGLPPTLLHSLNIHINLFPSSFPNKHQPVTGELSLFSSHEPGSLIKSDCFSESIPYLPPPGCWWIHSCCEFTAPSPSLLFRPLGVSSNNNVRSEFFGLLLKCLPIGTTKKKKGSESGKQHFITYLSIQILALILTAHKCR